MDANKQMGSPSSSSFTSDLFISKESSASSSFGIFGSIFEPSSKVFIPFSHHFELWTFGEFFAFSLNYLIQF
ncbi:hypothetical protein CsSME_00033261 [Camellia sinensis var. sinensis]